MATKLTTAIDVETDLDCLNVGEEASLTVEQQPSTAYKVAVISMFQLGSSQYATIALREWIELGNLRAF